MRPIHVAPTSEPAPVTLGDIMLIEARIGEILHRLDRQEGVSNYRLEFAEAWLEVGIWRLKEVLRLRH